jgi:chromosome partitioning protein
VALPKGGVGKTTTAVNLAASLAVAEKPTLLIDLDSVGSTGLSFGVTEQTSKIGIYEVFDFVTGIRDAVHRTSLNRLDVIPSNVRTFQREERLTKLADNRSLLKNLLRPVLDQYEYIILDCPPFLRGLTTNALVAADSVILTVKCGHFALDAVDKLLRYLGHLAELTQHTTEVEGILLTMLEPNTRVTDISIRSLKDRYGRFLFETVIPKNSTLSEATFYGQPTVLYDIHSRGAQAYLSLAREIIERSEERQPAPANVLSATFRRAE